MVIIANINKELEKYLANRCSRAAERRPAKRPVPLESQTGEVQVFEQEPTFWERLFKKKEEVGEELTPEERKKLASMEANIQLVDEAEQQTDNPVLKEELEEVRETLLERFFKLFRRAEHQHRPTGNIEVVEYAPTLDEDVKRVLKIVHRWLGKLPKRYKDAFKKSADFQEYKALLEKYGVARISEPRGEQEPTDGGRKGGGK